MSAAQGIAARLRVDRPGFTLDVDLQLPGQGFSVLFGPSGCGKTTCLRAIAGLERAPQARVSLAGEVWQDEAVRVWRPPHQRALGYVFQEASLFPHLSVRANIDYGLRRTAAARRRVDVGAVIDLLGLGALMDRRPATLSGGERQRVAIARALATSPRLLLMDEPLAALDAARKAEVLPYLERLQQTLDIPVVYVSHAIDEVVRLADHVVLLDAGRVRAAGDAQALFARPGLPFAQGDAGGALVAGQVLQWEAAHHVLHLAFGEGGVLQCVPPRGAPVPVPGQRVRLRVLARDVSLALVPPADSSVLNILPARVLSLADDGGGHAMAGLEVHGVPLLARITAKSAAALQLAPGMPVYAQVKGVALLDVE